MELVMQLVTHFPQHGSLESHFLQVGDAEIQRHPGKYCTARTDSDII